MLSSIIRIVAWLAVAGVIAWLLSWTLRTNDQLDFGPITLRDPAIEFNLRPFSNKIAPLRNLLLSDNLRIQRAARNYLFVDVAGNVAVFVPFGMALAAATSPRQGNRMRRRRWLWWLGVTAAGLALSLFIEIAQLAIPSRVTDIDDLIFNTLGTAIGALLVWCAFRLIKRT